MILLLLAVLALGALVGSVEAEEGGADGAETFEFKSETAKLMDIIVNSLYSNRDIFLRELLSNAADALEKARFVALKNPGLLGEGETAELKTRVWFDKEKAELYIQDSGIGMDREELITNLGTIAESGTKRFLEQQGQSADATTDLIGQFGVGFFSAFLVADEVIVDTVRTPHGEENNNNNNNNNTQPSECLRWRSNAVGTYTIENVPEEYDSIVRGTRLTLKMKANAMEYLDFFKLKNLVLEHSKFLPFPIYIRKEEEVEVEIEEEEENNEETKSQNEKKGEGEEEEEPKVQEVTEEQREEEEKQKKTRKEIKYTWEHINDIPVLWLRDKSQITKQEYKDFFQEGGLGKNYYEEPAGWIHFKGEGMTDYTALIYIPKMNPVYFLMNDNKMRAPGLRLYINRVFVTDRLDIVPDYLVFVTGILDTDNKLTINLSREMIQHSRQMTGIGRKITKKVFEWMDASSRKDAKRWEKYQLQLREYESAEPYENEEGETVTPEKPEKPTLDFYAFYANYADYLKYGITKDDENKKSLINQLRYPSTYTVEHSPECIGDLKDPAGNVLRPDTIATMTTLKKYVKRLERRNKDIIEQVRADFEALEEENNDNASEERPEFNEDRASPYLQKEIYYLIAPSFAEALTSPITEQARARNIEVLYLTNPIDYFMPNLIEKYKDYKFVDISDKNLKLPDIYVPLTLDNDDAADDDDNNGTNNNTNGTLTQDSPEAKLLQRFLKEELKDKVSSVSFSTRLTSSPVLLTLPGMNAAFQRIALSSVDAVTRTAITKERYNMEVNLDNPIVAKLAHALADLNDGYGLEEEEDTPVATDAMRRFARALLDAAVLQSGFVVDDLRAFSTRVYDLLGDSLLVQ